MGNFMTKICCSQPDDIKKVQFIDSHKNRIQNNRKISTKKSGIIIPQPFIFISPQYYTID